MGPRAAARIKTRSFGFDGAAGGRRLNGAGEIPLPLPAQIAANKPLGRRARYLASNNGHASAAVEAWVSALAGCGFKAQSQHPNRETRRALTAAFNRWCRCCDADGLTNFDGLLAMIARRVVVDGEIFIVFTLAESGELRLRLVDAEQVDGAYHTELASGWRIVAGIEFDGAGRRTAVHMWKQRPGLPVAISLELIRVPAEDVCHVFKTETPGQVRGTSWFASVLLRLFDLDSARDAQLMRQKVAALLAGFIVDPNGEVAGFEGKEDGSSALEGGLEPGTLKVLAPGQDIRFSDPANIGAEATQFLTITAHEISAGLGVPYEQMTGDLSGVNFSSIRAGLVEFRRRAEAIQFNMLVPQILDPVWRRFVTTEILSGRLAAPGFETDPEPYFAVNWLPPKTDWVDPLKDAQAELLAIRGGLMSRRQAVAARGYDLEELDAEIAADKAAANSLGLDFDASAKPPQNQAEEDDQ